MPIQELMISELPALPPVPSGEIPVSQMNGTARVTCKATVQELVQSVAPRTHSHTPADIGLGNVNNTSDANKPLSGPTATAIANALQAHVNATNPHPQYATTAQVAQIVTAQVSEMAGGIDTDALKVSDDDDLGDVDDDDVENADAGDPKKASMKAYRSTVRANSTGDAKHHEAAAKRNKQAYKVHETVGNGVMAKHYKAMHEVHKAAFS